MDFPAPQKPAENQRAFFFVLTFVPTFLTKDSVFHTEYVVLQGIELKTNGLFCTSAPQGGERPRGKIVEIWNSAQNVLGRFTDSAHNVGYFATNLLGICGINQLW